MTLKKWGIAASFCIVIVTYVACGGGGGGSGTTTTGGGLFPMPSGEISLGESHATFTGLAAEDQSGRAVANAGDVNGDGFDDFLIGAPYADPGSPPQPDAGTAYLIYGQTGMDAGTVLLSSANATFTGVAAGDRSGWSVSGAGDVNNDGYADILIGAPFSQGSTGVAYLIYGSSTLSGIISLSNADVTLTGVANNDLSGHSVSSAGDVNGDGFADLLIGAPSQSSLPSGGGAYLIYGSSNLGSTISLANADATYYTIAHLYLGYSVSGAGDVNNDGYDDMLMGAYGNYPNSQTYAGTTYLIYGSPSITGTINVINGLPLASAAFHGKATLDYSGFSVSEAGDVNGDGYDDLLIGAWGADVGITVDAGEAYLIFGSQSLNGTISLSDADVTFTGIAANNSSGRAVSNAGDINNDGFDDILIGAYTASTDPYYQNGETFLIYGAAALGGTISLVNADATFTGLGSTTFSGYAVSGAGDVNNDTFSDILIGAPGANPGARTSAGATYLILGGN